MSGIENYKKCTGVVTENPWASLRKFTNARIALGRAGVSLPTKHLLDFQLAHARAKDAVYSPLSLDSLLPQFAKQAWPSPPLVLHSRAQNRAQYLQRPDYGRRLDGESRRQIQAHMSQHPDTRSADLAIVIADGLSATGIMKNAAIFLEYLGLLLKDSQPSWSLAPLCIVQQGRVAAGDEVAELLQAKCLLMLIGERPGLSSPDSMGAYLTWAPKVGVSDAQRNCISNIRAEGIQWRDAAAKAFYLLTEARHRELSGVALKDRSVNGLTEIEGGSVGIPQSI
ncbi:MAG: ethanolamine ammonia-lyase subunit EutC [Cellvibrionaceae bacterium]|nr:ethanolamine ammonia-lyase subunit EutC [Cellvibrionaceae bacterium]